MTRAVWAFAVALVVAFGALAWNFARDEGTRERVERVTVDPCARPRSDACQRRIRLVLRELVRRHPGLLKRFDVKEHGASAPEGVVPHGSPTGGGPIGRVPSPGSPPAPPDAPEPPPEPDRPLIDLHAPVPLETCVGGLVGVNCR